MRPIRAASALAAFVLISGAPALAQSTPAPGAAAGNAANAELTARVDGAIANAASYRVQVAAPSGVSIDIREWRPDRVKVTTTTGAGTAERIIVGTAMYYREPGSAWKSAPVPPVSHVRRNRLFMGAPDTLLQPLPDRPEAGATYGAFRSEAVGNQQRPGTMDCTYDKETYRPRECTVTLQGSTTPIRVSYSGWDDAANLVEAPPGVTVPPAPSPSPSPRGTR
jgi:hypothetical protein